VRFWKLPLGKETEHHIGVTGPWDHTHTSQGLLALYIKYAATHIALKNPPDFFFALTFFMLYSVPSTINKEK